MIHWHYLYFMHIYISSHANNKYCKAWAVLSAFLHAGLRNRPIGRQCFISSYNKIDFQHPSAGHFSPLGNKGLQQQELILIWRNKEYWCRCSSVTTSVNVSPACCSPPTHTPVLPISSSQRPPEVRGHLPMARCSHFWLCVMCLLCLLPGYVKHTCPCTLWFKTKPFHWLYGINNDRDG